MALTISVITPSFNQAEFLKECLDSVSQQTLKPIEHLVFDPGSTDGSRAIAAAHPGVTLVAEPDEGQSDALAKGFDRVRGDIIAWVNSDDCYMDEGVFARVAERFAAPDAPDIVYGRGIYINEKGEPLRDVYINKRPETLSWRFQQEDGILQPATFIRRASVARVGRLSKHLHYSMDYEYWIRSVKAGLKWAYLDANLARARYHIHNKTYGLRAHSYREVCDMMLAQFGYVSHHWLRRYAEFIAEGWDGVLAHSGTAAARDQAAVEREYAALLRAYNTNADTWARLQEHAADKGYGDTLAEMKKLAIAPPTPCHTIPLDTQYEPGFVAYTVAQRRWAYAAGWKKEQIKKSHAFLRAAITARKTDVCIIAGNGPSLAKTPWDLLKDQDVIISNNSFLKPDLVKLAKYYTVVNYLVAEQGCQHINRLQGPAKVIPYWLSYCINEGPTTYFVDAVGYPEFSTDMFKNMSWRHTVSFFNMHLAYGLGYRTVILIGFDHSYQQAAGVKEAEIICSDQKDENHFDPAYFQGKKWQAADVTQMENMYRLAKAAFEAGGREIVNATAGGNLELFRRASLAECLGG